MFARRTQNGAEKSGILLVGLLGGGAPYETFRDYRWLYIGLKN